MNDVKPGDRPFRHAARGSVFDTMHRQLMGLDIDFEALDLTGVRPELLATARREWQHRALTEFRSIQIMHRFLGEVLGAGDPIEVYAGAVDLVADEVRHTALCVRLCEALGGRPLLPDKVELVERPEYTKMPAPQRALISAITMLAINETLSVGFVEDLAARCQDPVVGAVLRATCEDEETHQDFGWDYIRMSLARFDTNGRRMAKKIAAQALEPHRRVVEPRLDDIPVTKQHLDAWPDEEQVRLGLFSPQRQVLVWKKTYEEMVAPKLRELDLF